MFIASNLPSSSALYKRPTSCMFSLCPACSRKRSAFFSCAVTKKSSICLPAFSWMCSVSGSNRSRRQPSYRDRFRRRLDANFANCSVGVQRRLVESPTAVADCRHASHQGCIDQNHFEVHDRWCCREEVFVSVQSVLVPKRRRPGPFSLRHRAHCPPNVLSRVW